MPSQSRAAEAACFDLAEFVWVMWPGQHSRRLTLWIEAQGETQRVIQRSEFARG
jgi:hypothetical protein